MVISLRLLSDVSVLWRDLHRPRLTAKGDRVELRLRFRAWWRSVIAGKRRILIRHPASSMPALRDEIRRRWEAA